MNRRECLGRALLASMAQGFVSLGHASSSALAHYNERFIGSGRWQRVRLVLSLEGRELDSWSVFRAWTVKHRQIDTWTVLEGNTELRGTMTWVREQAAARRPSVTLLLPAARDVLSVNGEALHQGLLGSGFSHLDLSWLIYSDDGPEPSTIVHEGDRVTIRSARSTGERTYEFDSSRSLVKSARWANSRGRLRKEMTTLSSVSIEGVLTPRHQRMFDNETSVVTEMTLLAHGACGETFLAPWSSSEGLISLREQVRRGGKVAV